MKLVFLVLVVAVINPVFAGEGIQTNQAKSFELGPLPQRSPPRPEEWMFPADSGTNRAELPLTLTNLPALNFKAGELSTDGERSPQVPLKPGVYKTSPYTCLVLVPGPQHDDACILGPGTIGMEKMPVIQGGVNFIPYSFGQKSKE